MPPTVVGVGTAAAGVATITPGFPTPTGGFQDGDLIIGVGESVTDFPAAASNGFAHVGPAGSPVVQDTNTRLTVIWQRWTAGLTAHAWGDSGDHNLGCYLVVRDCSTSGDPWSAFAVGIDATLDNSATFPGVTSTIVADSLVLEIAAWSDDFAVAALPVNSNYTDITEHIDAVTNAGNDGAIFVASGARATVGATGQTTATLGGNATKAMMTLVLKPVVAGPPSEPPGLLIRSPRPAEQFHLYGPFADPRPSTLL